MMTVGKYVKRRIFVGSSTEGLEKAKQICSLLSSFDGVESVLWTDVFEPGLITFEALENMLLRCCAAVFVATPDDQSLVRGSKVQTPRSNILMEFGLVAGRIGRHCIAMCLFGGVTLPSDLAGLTVVEMGGAQSPQVAGSDLDLSPQEKLRRWTSTLLPTVEMIARTDILHGYTGRWEFHLQLDRWRAVQIAAPDYAYVKGMFDLVIPANGQAGTGLTHGRLYFKLANGAGADRIPYQGEYRTAHEITGACCGTDGALQFTSQAFAVEKIHSTGTPPRELSGLDFAEPWVAQWHFVPRSEPRSLEGNVSTDDVVGTHGKAVITKS